MFWVEVNVDIAVDTFILEISCDGPKSPVVGVTVRSVCRLVCN